MFVRDFFYFRDLKKEEEMEIKTSPFILNIKNMDLKEYSVVKMLDENIE
jgi:hypothetical protein